MLNERRTEATPERKALAQEHREWHAQRMARSLQEDRAPVYRTGGSCCLCGEPATAQVCGGCSDFMRNGGTL